MSDSTAINLEKISFEDIANLLVSEKVVMVSPAELHGLVCGQLASGARLSHDLWLQMAHDFLDIDTFSNETSKVGLVGLYQQSLGQFESIEMSIDMLLPDDDYEINQRVEALGQWVQGFLAGFGTQGKHSDKSLGTDAKEMLNDLAQISQVASVDLEEDEESETNFFELSEYVRMGALYIFTECNQMTEAVAESESPTIH
ncbi:UPF0149 family protein [Gammaproteobacteria bacterium AS21]|jgi:uncharacterized protein YgfB (UPF0149 family)